MLVNQAFDLPSKYVCKRSNVFVPFIVPYANATKSRQLYHSWLWDVVKQASRKLISQGEIMAKECDDILLLLPCLFAACLFVWVLGRWNCTKRCFQALHSWGEKLLKCVRVCENGEWEREKESEGERDTSVWSQMVMEREGIYNFVLVFKRTQFVGEQLCVWRQTLIEDECYLHLCNCVYVKCTIGRYNWT